jgi:hypothetical protein
VKGERREKEKRVWNKRNERDRVHYKYNGGREIENNTNDKNMKHKEENIMKVDKIMSEKGMFRWQEKEENLKDN